MWIGLAFSLKVLYNKKWTLYTSSAPRQQDRKALTETIVQTNEIFFGVETMDKIFEETLQEWQELRQSQQSEEPATQRRQTGITKPVSCKKGQGEHALSIRAGLSVTRKGNLKLAKAAMFACEFTPETVLTALEEQADQEWVNLRPPYGQTVRLKTSELRLALEALEITST